MEIAVLNIEGLHLLYMHAGFEFDSLLMLADVVDQVLHKHSLDLYRADFCTLRLVNALLVVLVHLVNELEGKCVIDFLQLSAQLLSAHRDDGQLGLFSV